VGSFRMHITYAIPRARDSRGREHGERVPNKLGTEPSHSPVTPKGREAPKSNERENDTLSD
jgi:hypothetical protein